MRGFFKRIALLLCICVLWAGNARVCLADNFTLMEAFFTAPEQYSGLMEVPGKGPMRYYAQNDPLWGALTYENEDTQTRRPFRDSGCSPAAAAMAVAALVPEDELCAISGYAKKEYSLCSCSINQARCNHRHSRYVLTSQRDFVRFLPLIFGDFATGNNTLGTYSRSAAAGTGTGYLKGIAQVYGLTMTITSDYEAACAALREGGAVVALAARNGVFTNTGHYVLLAHLDEERLYILDPLLREEYKTNQSSKLEIIQPGLVALTHANVSSAKFSNFIIFQK